MPTHQKLSRRGLLKGAGALGAALLTGCDQLIEDETAQSLYRGVEALNYNVQRALTGNALAAEFTEADLSPDFPANGTRNPDTEAYDDISKDGFLSWHLEVKGLVERPARLSLADLRAMPSRTQITRHDCVEGWSCIGKWKGARLSALLERVGLKPSARYIVFHCADELPTSVFGPPVPYYESIDLDDAFHQQTILAYDMNGETLPIRHGAPIRLRVERQLGYKQAKFIMAIEAVDSFASIGDGRGSYWADRGYAWYAGI